MLILSIAIGGVGCSVRGVAYTGRSLVMSTESSIGEVGEVTVGARLTPELAVRVVKSCALQYEAPSIRLPL